MRLESRDFDSNDGENEDCSSQGSESDQGEDDLYFNEDVEDPFSDSDTEDEDEDIGNANALDASSSQEIGVVNAITDSHPIVSASAIASPPAKRQRIVAEGAVNDDDNKSTNLGGFMSMPLDVQLEIFSNLPPKDILRVARTTKPLRQMLMTKKAVGVWKKARENVELPECPPWISEPAWVALLFGDTCECCGSRKKSGFNTNLLKRLCIDCLYKNFRTKETILHSNRSINERTFDLIPTVTLQGDYYTKDYFWVPDLKDVDRRQVDLQRNIDKEITGAKSSLDEFRTQLLDKCTYMAAHRNELGVWRMRYFDERSENLQLRRSKRLSDVKERLFALGYVEEDIPSLTYTQANRSNDLTPQVWKRIRPLLVEKVEATRAARLEEEARKRRRRRLSLFEERYLDFKKTLHPSKWKSLMPSSFLFVLEPFVSLLTAELDSALSEKMVDGLFQEVSVISSRRERQLILYLWPLVPSSENPPPIISDPHKTSSIDRLRLTLATTAFKSKASCETDFSYVFGLDEASLHHHGTGIVPADLPGASSSAESYCHGKREEFEQYQFEQAPGATRVVEEIVKPFGLNPNTATPTDIDRSVDEARAQGKSLKFACGGCAPVKERLRQYRTGYDWRNLAAHFDQAEAGHELSVIELDSTHMATIASNQAAVPSLTHWVCTRCHLHAAKGDVRSQVEKHLNTVHSISSPVEKRDLIATSVPQINGKQGTKFLVSENGTTVAGNNSTLKNSRCLRCATITARARLFTDSGVKSHLLAKHNISNPQLKIDYEHVV